MISECQESFPQLPKSREALAGLLLDCRGAVEFIGGIHHRQMQRVGFLRRAVASSAITPTDSILVDELSNELGKQAAIGCTRFDMVSRLVEQSRYSSLARQFAQDEAAYVESNNAVIAAFGGADQKNITPQTRVLVLAGALQQWARTTHEIRELFVDLEVRCIRALDASADTTADTNKKIRRVAPRDQKVFQLYLLIEENQDPSMTKKQIAIDFAADHGGNYETLLRGVRRFRERRNRLPDARTL